LAKAGRPFSAAATSVWNSLPEEAILEEHSPARCKVWEISDVSQSYSLGGSSDVAFRF